MNNNNAPQDFKRHTFVLKVFKNSQLIKYPKLTELYFNPTSHIDFDLRAFTQLCKGLKTLRSLNTLSLNFSFTKQLEEKHLKELSLALRQLHGLTILSLNFKKNSKITGAEIAKLLKIVKKNKFLSELYLDFSGCGRVSEVHLESIYSNISKMKLLTKFHFNHFDVSINLFERPELTGNLLKLKGLYSLKDFSMNLKLQQGLRSCEVFALSKSIRRMPRLSKVYLNFGQHPNFDESSLKSLASSLRSLTKLQKLHLRFTKSFFVGQNIYDIVSQAFENSPTLSNLVLDFIQGAQVRNLPDNLTLQSLCRGIMNLTNLSSLKLNFSQCPTINGEGLLFIADALRNLTSLKTFELSLTKKSLKSAFPTFTDALGCLTNLSKLLLNFTQSQDLGNEEVKALAGGLQKFENLEYLELSFSFAPKITDEGLRVLVSCIGNLQSLKILTLNFFGCNKITLKGCKFLKSQLALLESLKQINLSFPKTISSSGLVHQQSQQQSSNKSACSIF